MHILKTLAVRFFPLKVLIPLGFSLWGAMLALPLFAAYERPATSLIQPGDQVVLHQPIDVDHGARIYIQYGAVKGRSSIYQLEPYCYFYFNRQRDALKQPVALQAGDYPIAAVNNRRQLVQRTRKQYATSFTGDGGGVQYTLATKIHLQSPANPELDSLICGIWADPWERRHLSLKEIIETLGDLVSIRIKNN